MYKTKNHSKYSLKVHIVFVTKYRKQILKKEITDILKQKILEIAEKSDFRIELMETDKDHIHLLIDYDPKVSVVQIVRRLKQETTYTLWSNFSNYLENYYWKKKQIWSGGYFACNIGECASYDTIQSYIRNQG